MRDRGWQIALVLCTWLASAGASADVVVIVPPHVEQGVTSEQSERALDALERGLKANGFDLVLPGQSGPAAEEEQHNGRFSADPLNCVTPDCATAYARLFDASFAVQLSMFREPGAGISLTLVIVESASTFFSGSASVEGGDVAGAVRDAYQEARKKQAEGVGPWLTVSGTPEGATVYIDGAEFGRVPIQRRRISAGIHRLVLRADGYATHNDSINIPERIDHEEARLVTLERIDEGAAPNVASSSSSRRRHWLDYVVGGAGIAGGATFLALGVREYLTDGDCVERRDNGSCQRAIKRDSLSVINIAGGTAGMLLGAATIWVGPFGLWLDADTQHATLGAHGSF